MKRNFTAYLVLGAILFAGVASSMQVLGQSGPNRQMNGFPSNGPGIGPGNGPYQNPIGPTNPPVYTTQGIPLNPMYGTPTVGYAIPHMPNGRPAVIVKKDGTIDRIEKEPGVPFSPEEMQAINETKQKLQIAVAQIKSPDAEATKKKEAKEFIARYLKAEFQADQESRREQVERLEKQVEQLKTQLAKREESQDKLVELRLQLLENDASGLSFPDSWGSLSGQPPYAGYPMQPPVIGSPSQPYPAQPSYQPYPMPIQPYAPNSGYGPSTNLPTQIDPSNPSKPERGPRPAPEIRLWNAQSGVWESQLRQE